MVAMTTQPSERSQQVAKVFDRVALTYDSVGVAWFRPIAEHLVRELAPAPGERGLDVGCGRGAVLLPMAEAVGRAGQVTGIDLAPGMVEAMRTDIEMQGLTNADVCLQDAAAQDLGGAKFDLLASSLVLFFLPEPAAALRRWLYLLVPGGRIGVSTFGPRDENFIAVDEVFTPFLPEQLLDARTSGAAGPFGGDDGVEGLLSGAGFVDVRTTHLDVGGVFRDADHWVEWSWSHGQRAMWEAVPQERHAEVRAEVARILERARDESGTITLRQQVRYTLGRRPGV
jgi:ubiquinone/menaquinone biosynthesis C-methylase UbiE